MMHLLQKMKPIAGLLAGLFFITNATMAQQDSIQNLYFVENGLDTAFGHPDYQPSKNGFYIYRNCVYELMLKNKKRMMVRIIDIARDSIYYTIYITNQAAAWDHALLDTLSLHPSQLKKILLIADRLLGIRASFSLMDCRYVLEKSASPKIFERRMRTVYAEDSSYSEVYEMVPYLTAQGINRVFVQEGKTYYYEGAASMQVTKKTDSAEKPKPPIIKKGVWVTPTPVNKISGVNIGLITDNLEADPLTIEGVNLNADALSMILTFYAAFTLTTGNDLINMPDTVEKSNTYNYMSGLSISGGGLMGDTKVKGVSINGGICYIKEARGLVITGTQNETEEFGGVVISAIRNRAIKGKGVQIGLFNICKHLKGFQLGLWNVNSKRKLPLINWSF